MKVKPDSGLGSYLLGMQLPVDMKVDWSKYIELPEDKQTTATSTSTEKSDDTNNNSWSFIVMSKKWTIKF